MLTSYDTITLSTFSIGGHQHIIFTKFSEKLLSYIKHPAYLIVLWLPTHKYTHIAVAINKATLHEIEKILVHRGVPGAPPLDPPLTSYWMFCELSWHTPSISCSFRENLTNSYGGTRFPPRDVPPPPTHTLSVIR